MKKTLTYKGFTGSVKREEDGTFFGTVLDISGIVLYVGDNMADLEKKFREAVDDHLDWCESEGWDPVNAPEPAQAKAARV